MNKLLAELRQRQRDLKAEAEKLLDAADASNDGNLTAEQEARYTAIEAELATVGDSIKREERNMQRRAELGAIQTVPANSISVNDRNPATTAGFKDIAEFALAVTRASPRGGGVVDKRLGDLMAAPTGYHEGGGSVGEGYLVPAEFRDQIWEIVTAQDNIFETTDLEPTASRQVNVISDETTPWGATGIQAAWRGEGEQMSATKVVTKGKSVPLHELYAFVLATQELLEDAPRLAARVTNKAAQAIGWKIDESIIYGNGAGKPLGWMTSGALVTVAKESGQAADTIVVANILKMYARLLTVPGSTPYWLANRNVVPQLATLTIGNQPVWMAPNGLISAPGGMLLGLPVRFTEQAKTLGDLGDIQLVDPMGYYSVRRSAGVQFAQSMHLFFDYNMEALRWTFRFGGQPHLSAPVSPANGTDTKSHFVALAERA